MSNISQRFTFRNGRTYLTGYPEWPGVHNLNEQIYKQYDTLYIGPKIPGQEVYYIIGPEYTTGQAPKLSVAYHDDDYQLDGGSVITPGLHMFVANAYDEGYHELMQDPPNIMRSIESYKQNLLLNVEEDVQTCRMITVYNHQTVRIYFSDMNYDAGNSFIPKIEPAFHEAPPSTLILPLGNFTADVSAAKNGYMITTNFIASTVYVYGPDGAKMTAANFPYYLTVPVVVEVGPRIHFQSGSLGLGEHWYDTCYHIRIVNLTDTSKNNPT